MRGKLTLITDVNTLTDKEKAENERLAAGAQLMQTYAAGLAGTKNKKLYRSEAALEKFKRTVSKTVSRSPSSKPPKRNKTKEHAVKQSQNYEFIMERQKMRKHEVVKRLRERQELAQHAREEESKKRQLLIAQQHEREAKHLAAGANKRNQNMDQEIAIYLTALQERYIEKQVQENTEKATSNRSQLAKKLNQRLNGRKTIVEKEYDSQKAMFQHAELNKTLKQLHDLNNGLDENVQKAQRVAEKYLSQY